MKFAFSGFSTIGHLACGTRFGRLRRLAIYVFSSRFAGWLGARLAPSQAFLAEIILAVAAVDDACGLDHYQLEKADAVA